MTVEHMLKTCFDGIYHNDNYKILGLNPEPVQSVNDISVDDILKYV